MQYPLKKFLSALLVGRAIRYTLVAYLASLYGHSLIRWMYRYYRPMLIGLIVLGVCGGLIALYYWRKHKRRGKSNKTRPQALAA
jgi:membrane protein DedA with SNARE-associated domain